MIDTLKPFKCIENTGEKERLFTLSIISEGMTPSVPPRRESKGKFFPERQVGNSSRQSSTEVGNRGNLAPEWKPPLWN